MLLCQDHLCQLPFPCPRNLELHLTLVQTIVCRRCGAIQQAQEDTLVWRSNTAPADLLVLCARTRLHEESQPLASSQAGMGVACCSRRASAERPPLTGLLSRLFPRLVTAVGRARPRTIEGQLQSSRDTPTPVRWGKVMREKFILHKMHPSCDVCVCVRARVCVHERCVVYWCSIQ